MFRVIIEKEIREIVGSTKFGVSYGICALLIILTFYVGAAEYRVNRSEYEAAVAENRAQLEGVTNWSEAVNRIFLSPEPLAVLVSGLSNDVGRTIAVGRYGKTTPYESRYSEKPIFAIFRFLDLEFLFGVVLSLFAILLCYDSISGEKERGTLRLVFSHSIPRPVYLAGKIAGAVLAIGVPLLMAIAAGSLLLVILGVPMSAVAWGRLVLIVLLGLVYVLCFMSVAVLVSALTRRSVDSLLILLIFWIATVQLIPQTSVLLAARVIEVPSVDELTAQEDRLNSQLYKEYQDKVVKFTPSPGADGNRAGREFHLFTEKLLSERLACVQDFAARLNEDRENKQHQQARLAFSLARLSPAASFTLAAALIAGTNIDLISHFSRQAQLYQLSFAAFLKQKMESDADVGMNVGNTGTQSKLKSIDVSGMPVFQYSAPPLCDALGSLMLDLGLLLVYNLLAFTCAFVVFNRYDLR